MRSAPSNSSRSARRLIGERYRAPEPSQTFSQDASAGNGRVGARFGFCGCLSESVLVGTLSVPIINVVLAPEECAQPATLR